MKIEDVYNKYSNEQIDEFEEIAESECCKGCKKRNKNCSDCYVFYKKRDETVLLGHIKYLEKQVSDCMKDMSVMTDINPTIYYKKMHHIKVLEKALELACYELKCPYQQLDNTKVHTLFNFYKDGEEINLIDYFKKQAEKELGGKK